MAGYDPQRTRHRPRPSNGSSAPVDSILDGPAEAEAELADEPALDEPPAAPESAIAGGDTAADAVADTSAPPERVPAPSAIDLSSVPPPPPGLSPARLIAGGGLVAFLLALLWWRLRSRRSDQD